MKWLIILLLHIFCAGVYAQNVGVGTTTPTHPLTVQTGNNYGLMHKGINTWLGSYTSDLGYGWLGTVTAHPLHLGTAESITATILANGNWGIGTQTPKAPFTVAAGKTVLFGDDTLGAGNKLMWIPEKGAFRVGSVASNNWDYSNVGTASIAVGENTIASGSASGAFGKECQATGNRSFAIGENTFTSGNASTAIGYLTKALAGASTAMGNATTALAGASTAMGFRTFATGDGATATGYGTTARAFASFSTGSYNDSIASSNQETWVATDPIFIIGNGSVNAARHNATVIYKNGNADLNGFVRLGEIIDGAPRIKTKKITGFNTPGSTNPNTFTFVPHGIGNPNKILSISVLVTDGNFQLLPHSTEAGLLYTVNTDPNGGGLGPSIAVGVKTAAQSSSVMGKPIKIFITYEE
jgi:hypothetical protein